MWTCHHTYHSHTSQWPTIITVIYGQSRSTLLADLSHNPLQGNLHHHTPLPPFYFQQSYRRRLKSPSPPSSLHLLIGSTYAPHHTPVAPWMLMWGGKEGGVIAWHREQHPWSAMHNYKQLFACYSSYWVWVKFISSCIKTNNNLVFVYSWTVWYWFHPEDEKQIFHDWVCTWTCLSF